MIKIAHYVDTLRFVRAHLTFEDTSEVTHHYLVPLFHKRPNLANLAVGTEVIKGGQKWEFKNADREVPKLLSRIGAQIVLTSNTPSQMVISHCRRAKIPIIYLRHGIGNKHSVQRIVNMTRPRDPFMQLSGYITHESEKYQYIKMKIPPKKILTIEGSTMIDYLRSLNLSKLRKRILSQISRSTGNFTVNPSDPLPPDQKCILLLQNHQGVTKYDVDRRSRPEAVREYCLILERLVKYADVHDLHIFTKLKGNGGDLAKIMKVKSSQIGQKIVALHRNPRVTLLFWDQEVPMYHFLWCDVVVVEACGTSLPEAMIVNPKVIQCQILAHNDYYEIDKYRLLPQADDLDQLEEWIDRLLYHDETVLKKAYYSQQDEFIKQFYGRLELVTPKIVEFLINRAKKP